MDNRIRVAIAVSQNYYTILDRRKRYARHIDTLNEMRPDIDMTEIPMAPRLVAYRKKSEDYRKSQKKLDDECIAMLRKTYREKEMARRHQKRPGTTRDWIAELGKVRTGKKPTPTNTFANPPELRPLRSQRSYKTPAAAKIIFPDDNEQITANELYEPIGLEDGMQVTDQGPASTRSQRSNYVSFGQYPVAPPNQPKSARGNYRNSGTIKEPSNDSSTRSKRKVLVSQTQTEPESQEYESDYLGESEDQIGQNKINTLGDTFESINSSLANTGKKSSEKESEKEESAKERNVNESETKSSENNKSEKSDEEKEESEKEKSENNESEKESEKEKSENNESEKESEKEKSENNESEKESEKEKSENNESEKHSDDMEDDFESTTKSDLNSTAKSDLNSTMKSDFDETDSKDENESENKDDDDDEDKSEDKKDDDDDDDDDDEDKSEDKKDDDDDDDEEKESDPFAD